LVETGMLLEVSGTASETWRVFVQMGDSKHFVQCAASKCNLCWKAQAVMH